jgi:hypothetical protein
MTGIIKGSSRTALAGATINAHALKPFTHRRPDMERWAVCYPMIPKPK